MNGAGKRGKNAPKAFAAVRRRCAAADADVAGAFSALRRKLGLEVEFGEGTAAVPGDLRLPAPCPPRMSGGGKRA